LPEVERTAILELACPDADLRSRVQALLAAEQTRDRVESPGDLLTELAGVPLLLAKAQDRAGGEVPAVAVPSKLG